MVASIEETAAETGIINVPRVEDVDELPDELLSRISFVYGPNPVLACLEKIGIVEKKKLYEDRLVTEETLEILESLFLGRRRALYQYVVLCDYPQWTTYLRSDLMWQPYDE